MKIKPYLIFLGLIILIGAFLRLYNLSNIPPGPTVDEASIGWNAYSILKTGADEYGTKLPVLLRAYDDWRPAIYAYLVVPFVSLFGLNVIAIRLPSITLSILTIIAVYFLTRHLTKSSNSIKVWNLTLDIPIIATLLFAISPMSIYLSRLGHEVNASFSFLIFGLLFFFRFMEKKRWNLLFSALFFGLSFDSYQSTKFIAPFLVIALLVLFYKQLIKEKFIVLFSALVGLLIIAPILFSTFEEDALIRFKATSLLGNSSSYFGNISLRNLANREEKDILGLIYDNRKIAAGLLISNAYLSHFDPAWLFSNKGDEPFKSPTMGLLYPIELPLILISFLFLLNSGVPRKNIALLIILGLSAIVPASITTGYPHGMRVYSLLPIPQILGGVGLISLLIFIKDKRRQTLTFSLFLFAVFASALWFYHSYFSLLPRELGHHFQYGVIGALEEAKKIDKKYDLVVVSNKDRLFESYMFYLYLTKYDPSLYQRMGGTRSGGFAEEHTIDNYTFGDIKDKIAQDQLYIINPEEKTPDMQIIREIKYENGKTALILTEIL